jgi:hypothetical protein
MGDVLAPRVRLSQHEAGSPLVQPAGAVATGLLSHYHAVSFGRGSLLESREGRQPRGRLTEPPDSSEEVLVCMVFLAAGTLPLAGLKLHPPCKSLAHVGGCLVVARPSFTFNLVCGHWRFCHSAGIPPCPGSRPAGPGTFSSCVQVRGARCSMRKRLYPRRGSLPFFSLVL